MVSSMALPFLGYAVAHAGILLLLVVKWVRHGNRGRGWTHLPARTRGYAVGRVSAVYGSSSVAVAKAAGSGAAAAKAAPVQEEGKPLLLSQPAHRDSAFDSRPGSQSLVDVGGSWADSTPTLRLRRNRAHAATLFASAVAPVAILSLTLAALVHDNIRIFLGGLASAAPADAILKGEAWASLFLHSILLPFCAVYISERSITISSLARDEEKRRCCCLLLPCTPRGCVRCCGLRGIKACGGPGLRLTVRFMVWLVAVVVATFGVATAARHISHDDMRLNTYLDVSEYAIPPDRSSVGDLVGVFLFVIAALAGGVFLWVRTRQAWLCVLSVVVVLGEGSAGGAHATGYGFYAGNLWEVVSMMALLAVELKAMRVLRKYAPRAGAKKEMFSSAGSDPSSFGTF